MIVIEKDTERVDIPRGLGLVSFGEGGGQGGVTPEEARQIATEVVDSALTEYSTTSQINSMFAAESARTEEAYAKRSELEGLATEDFVNSAITQSLENYNPTSNFKTINGNSIIGQGDIEIQGGDGGNYLIVDSLDEIENPVEGMRAWVNDKYTTVTGYTVEANPDFSSDHYAGWIGVPDISEELNIYYTGGDGNRQWHWDWNNDGEWHDREFYGHHVQYRCNGEHFQFFSKAGEELSFRINYEEEVPASSAVQEAFEYLDKPKNIYAYFDSYGWIPKNILLQEGMTIEDENTGIFLREAKPEVVLDNGLYIFADGNRYFQVTAIEKSWETNYNQRFKGIITENITFDVMYNYWDFHIEALNRKGLCTNDTAYTYRKSNGREGGIYYKYDYYMNDGFEQAYEGGRWLIGNISDDYRARVEILKDNGSDGGSRLKVQIYEGDSEIMGWDSYETYTDESWSYEVGGSTFKIIKQLREDEYSDRGRIILCNIPLTVEAGTNLSTSISSGLVVLNSHGLQYNETIPTQMAYIDRGEKPVVAYSKVDIKEFAKEECVDNVRGVKGIWKGTEAEYAGLTPDPNVLYIIVN